MSPRGGGPKSYLACIRDCVNRSRQVSRRRGGGFRSNPATIVARVFHSRQVHHPEATVSDHKTPGSPIARNIVGKFITPKRRFRIIGRADRRSRVSQLAGVSHWGAGVESCLACSEIACVIAGRFLTQRRRFRSISRVGRSPRVSLLTGLSPRGTGFGS